VIFDRIRENTLDYLAEEEEEQGKKKKKKVAKAAFDRAEVFDRSLRQTMRRSLATSISTLLVIAGMYVFGT
jgi:preprotein translocase subunit SecF